MIRNNVWLCNFISSLVWNYSTLQKINICAPTQPSNIVTDQTQMVSGGDDVTQSVSWNGVQVSNALTAVAVSLVFSFLLLAGT